MSKTYVVLVACLIAWASADAGAASLHFTLAYDPTTGTTEFVCKGSSTGRCVFWIGDLDKLIAPEFDAAGGWGARLVSPISKDPMKMTGGGANPVFCATAEETPPVKISWAECVAGRLGGTVHQTSEVDFHS